VENPEKILFSSVTFSGEKVLGLACIVRVLSGKGRKEPASHAPRNVGSQDPTLIFGSEVPVFYLPWSRIRNIEFLGLFRLELVILENNLVQV
jgi:hypothetical protein